MKRQLAVTGIALVVSILLSSPALAGGPPPAAKPAPAPVVAEVSDVNVEEMSIDEAIMYASTPEERHRVMMRCAGPPPRPADEVAEVPVLEPTPAG